METITILLLAANAANFLVFSLFSDHIQEKKREKWFKYTMILGIFSILVIIGVLSLMPIDTIIRL